MKKNRFLKILILIVSLSFVTCKQESISQNMNAFSKVKYNNELPLDSFIIAIQKHYQLPGLAIATINNTKINEIAIVGENKTKNGVAFNSNSKFQIASCTKSFTALLVASFVDDGLINWNTKISEVFTDNKIHKDFKDITIRQILSHISGLKQFWTDDEVFDIHSIIHKLLGNTVEKRKRFAIWNLTQEANFKNSEHHYSNGGYVIIASILEELTGKSYEELMTERIFKPLELSSAEFGYPFAIDSTQPYRHMYRDENGIGVTMNKQDRIPNKIFNPSGFISLTIEDFAKFVLFHIQAINNKETIIKNSIVQKLFKPELILPDNNEVGLGWQIIYVNGVKTYGHTGSDQTIRAAMSINPKTGKAVVFATNIGDQRSEMAMVNVIFELLDL